MPNLQIRQALIYPLKRGNSTLAIVGQIKDEISRAYALNALAFYLPEDHLTEVWKDLETFLNLDETIDILKVLQPRWDELRDQMNLSDLELITRIVSIYSKSTRKTFLKMVEILAPQFEILGGTPLLMTIVESIKKTAKWWP